MPSYDIIGDIHGQADKLIRLLEGLGYVEIDGVFQCDCESPQATKVVFVGDFVDGNSGNRRVLDIVRPMVDKGHALAVMGNHEFNAICYHSRHPETGEPLREHSRKNLGQHADFLTEFPLDDPDTQEVIAWFRSLPLFLELETSAGLNVYEVDDDSDAPQRVQFADRIRIVHACWNQDCIDRVTARLGPHAVIDDDFLVEAAQEGTEAFRIVETLLKGPEIALPDDRSFRDAYGNERRSIRIAWWKCGQTYRDVALVPHSEREAIPGLPLPDDWLGSNYPTEAPPVFFGHYRMSGEQWAQRHNVACLDYGADRDGPLAAYMWLDGGSQLGAGTLRGDRFTSTDALEEKNAEVASFPESQLRFAWQVAKDSEHLHHSDRCGCFYCLSVFEPDEIDLDDDWPVCPRCGVDYVIGTVSGLPINRRFLAEAKEFWLEPPFPVIQDEG